MFDNVRKYAVAYLVAFGGVLLTCLSSWNVRQELQSNHLKEFEWAADDRIQAVRVAVDQALDALYEVREIHRASLAIKEPDFRVLTDTLLKRRSYIHSLLWASWAPVANKAERTAALPVRLSASRAGADYAVGVDLLASKDLAALFERAAQTGQVAISGRREFLLPGKPALQVIYAALPVQSPDTGKMPAERAVIGFLVGVYLIEDLVHSAISVLEPRGVDVRVSDVTDGETQFLHHYSSRLGRGNLPTKDEDTPQKAVTVEVGDRLWDVRCVARDRKSVV